MLSPSRVFISHCAEDTRIASAICAALYQCATSPSCSSRPVLDLGQEPVTNTDREWLIPSVRRAIDEASHFIALLSPAALRSPSVIAEVHYASACALTRRMLQLIPVVVAPLEPSALSVWFHETSIYPLIAVDPNDVSGAVEDILGLMGLSGSAHDTSLLAHSLEQPRLSRSSAEPYDSNSMDLAADWYRLGIACMEHGEHEDAEQALRQARSLATQAGAGIALANIDNELGSLYILRGDFTAALTSYREAMALYAVGRDLANQGRAHSNAAFALCSLGRHDEARAELAYALACKAPFGHAAEPWTTLAILRDLEREQGNQDAAARAHEQALQHYVAYRRTGGSNTTMGGMLCSSVVDAITYGAKTALASRLAALAMEPECPAATCALIGALSAVLGGSRDLALVHNQDLSCEDAGELYLVIKALR